MKGNRKKLYKHLVKLGCYPGLAELAAKYVDDYTASRWEHYSFISAVLNGPINWNATSEGYDFWKQAHDFYYDLERKFVLVPYYENMKRR